MRRSCNLLFLVQSDFIGGAEIVLHVLLSALNKKRFKCFMLFYKKGKVCEYFSDLAVERVTIEDVNRRLQFIRMMAGGIKINAGYFYSFLNLREAILMKSLKVPLVFHGHNLYTPANYIHFSRQRKQIIRAIVCLAERVVACSDAVKQQFKGTSLYRQVTTVYNGIDVDRFLLRGSRRFLRREFNIPASSLVIAEIGKIQPAKRQDVLLRSAVGVLSRYPGCCFMLIGDCRKKYKPFERQLKSFAKKTNISNRVYWTGFRADVPKIISDIDILVLPSLDESFPVCVLEGMAAGKAIIAVDSGGVSEIIENGKNGILVRRSDPRLLAEAILLLLMNEKLRRILGENARKQALKAYRSGRFIKKMERIFYSMS